MDTILGDVLGGYEFNGTRGPASTQPGWRRLLFAMLMDAIRLYQGGTAFNARGGPRQFRADAEAWIAEDNAELMGFVNVCEVLGIEPGGLREGLRDWRAREARGAPVRRVSWLVATPRTLPNALVVRTRVRGQVHKRLARPTRAPGGRRLQHLSEPPLPE